MCVWEEDSMSGPCARERIKKNKDNEKVQWWVLIIFCLFYLLCRDLVCDNYIEWDLGCCFSCCLFLCFQMKNALFPPIGLVISLHKNSNNLFILPFLNILLLCPLHTQNDMSEWMNERYWCTTYFGCILA